MSELVGHIRLTLSLDHIAKLLIDGPRVSGWGVYHGYLSSTNAFRISDKSSLTYLSRKHIFTVCCKWLEQGYFSTYNFKLISKIKFSFG